MHGAEPLACPALQSDYGLMVFADTRYQRHDKRDKLPGWITSQLRDAHLNLSTDMLLAVARQFMRGMGQARRRRMLSHMIMAACRRLPDSPVHTCCCPLFADLCQNFILHMQLVPCRNLHGCVWPLQPYDKLQIGKSLLTEAQVNSIDANMLTAAKPAGLLQAP